MRLLSHNFLCCLQCDSYPLAIDATAVVAMDVAYDAEFTRRMLARMDYGYLVAAYRALALKFPDSVRGGALPDTIEGADLSDESEFLQVLHYAMNVIAVRDGELRCPSCSTRYMVSDFIPNFVLENK
ncbi:multifunctional methyltransferase subunit TRM112 [Strigomonas culicis]|uniref:Multifunctional methyltransferase subunit TRM112 n=1 Tax=Strigomonas culicis TaxID=28005 RepID=S9W969_9TRYP|nr:multifunctional methyltransferase subunit TRM112 [Strigomonas culicis]|eukprot:EPY35811.1 multifunctional methyltransferase subunit TRM112 [Strigomonas culicis]